MKTPRTNADVCLNTYNTAKPFIKNFRTAIDIGCRDGDFTRPMSKDFIRVKAFDYRRRQGVADAEMPNVLYFQVALADTEEVVKAYAGVITDVYKEGEGPKPQNVKQRLLDSYYFDTVDLIKIDVEGHEMKVIRGAEKTIKKCWPTIIIEENGSAEKWGKEEGAVDYLKNIGYKVVAKYKNDLVLTREV